MIHRLLLVVVLLGGIAAPAAAAATTTADDDGARRVFELSDDRIFESSGLADLGSLMATVNDSGDSSRVFVLDPESGETVGVTDFHTEVADVEALAPAGPRAVYVGDIGDNRGERDEVVVHRVPVGRVTSSTSSRPASGSPIRTARTTRSRCSSTAPGGCT